MIARFALLLVLSFFSLSSMASQFCHGLNASASQSSSCHESSAPVETHFGFSAKSDSSTCPICLVRACAVTVNLETHQVLKKPVNQDGLSHYIHRQIISMPSALKGSLGLRSLWEGQPDSFNWQAVYSVFII